MVIGLEIGMLDVVALVFAIGFDCWGITVDSADWIGINMVLSQVLMLMLELGNK